jgi:multiple sugar transport system permease protein
MVIYLAGLSNVPTMLLEAIEIDGGGTWAKFRHITIPMISPVMFYNSLMGIIGGFMSFTNTYVMTGGGPNNQTLYVNLLVYRYAFEYNRMGYASALGWVVFIVLALITAMVFRFFGKRVYYGNVG